MGKTQNIVQFIGHLIVLCYTFQCRTMGQEKGILILAVLDKNIIAGNHRSGSLQQINDVLVFQPVALGVLHKLHMFNTLRQCILTQVKPDKFILLIQFAANHLFKNRLGIIRIHRAAFKNDRIPQGNTLKNPLTNVLDDFFHTHLPSPLG